MPDVRFGSKADICGAKRHVRFTPESDRKSGHLCGPVGPKTFQDKRERRASGAAIRTAYLVWKWKTVTKMIMPSVTRNNISNEPSPRPLEKPNHLSKKSIANRAHDVC